MGQKSSHLNFEEDVASRQLAVLRQALDLGALTQAEYDIAVARVQPHTQSAPLTDASQAASEELSTVIEASLANVYGADVAEDVASKTVEQLRSSLPSAKAKAAKFSELDVAMCLCNILGDANGGAADAHVSLLSFIQASARAEAELFVSAMKSKVLWRLSGVTAARRSCSAFQSQAVQRVLKVHDSVLALVRTPSQESSASENMDAVLCLMNMSEGVHDIDIDAAFTKAGITPASEGQIDLWDLLGGSVRPASSGELGRQQLGEIIARSISDGRAGSIQLVPYQSMWLQRRPAAKSGSSSRLPHLRVASLDEPLGKEMLQDDRSKIVHLMRHGQSDPDIEPKSLYEDECIGGRWLNEQGRLECIGKLVGCNVEMVMCSPMMRALESTIYAFEPEAPAIPQSFTSTTPAGDVEFARQVSGTVPPVEAFENLRSRMGAHMRSKRQSVTELEKFFPDVDFSAVKSDEDILWSEMTETREMIDERVGEFVQLLMTRSEKNIAVVTHLSVILSLLLPSSDHQYLGRNWNRQDDDLAIFNASCASDAGKLSSIMQPGECRSFVCLPQD